MKPGARSLILTQAVGNAVLLGLGYFWLGMGESRAAALIWSAVVALLILCGACWVHGISFVWAADPKPRLRVAAATAGRNLAPLLLAALLVIAVYALLANWADYSRKPAFQLASWLTLTLRKPVKPATVARIFDAVLAVVRWVVVPVLLGPVIGSIATWGWRGFRAIGKARRLYWIQGPATLLCALWLPFRVYGWVPHMNGFWLEMTSFVVRVLIAYLLFLLGSMAFAFLTSAGSPRWTQPKTVASP